jgi:hypothetical protein
VEPEGADRFLTPDLAGGRMVEVIERGEPALMVCHWTGIYWNGEERGLKVFQEVERRLRARFADRILWMKLSEVARYWAARELTRLEAAEGEIRLQAPFACPGFTLSHACREGERPVLRHAGVTVPLKEVASRRALETGCWCRGSERRSITCFDLVKGESALALERA